MPPPLHRFYRSGEAVLHVALSEPHPAHGRVPEAFVQDLWSGRRFDGTRLYTTDGRPVVILDPGRPNTDAGPDFSNARVRIGTTTWSGDVEVHVASGGWYAHGHHRDAVYDRAVLHVTLDADMWTGHLLRSDGTPLPELVLRPHLTEPVRRLLHAFHTRRTPDPPCAASWPGVPDALRRRWIEGLSLKRLRAARDAVAAAVEAGATPEDVLHRRLFAALGYAKNADPMRALADRLPLALVRDVARNAPPDDVEALHLGIAGLLPAPADLLDADRATADHVMALRDRYDRLRARLDVEPLTGPGWRRFRLRPANFPALRVAQAAALFRPGALLRTDPLLRLAAAVQSADPVPQFRAALAAEPGAFWRTHVRPDRRTRPRSAGIGRARRGVLLVNAVVPVLLYVAERARDTGQEAAALELVARMPAGRDEVTRRFAALGSAPEHALEAHGLHALYRTYCTAGRCLSCDVGKHLLTHGASPDEA